MKLPARAIAFLCALSFAVSSRAATWLFLGNGSRDLKLLKAADWPVLADEFMWQMFALVVGYLVWGALLGREMKSRGRALAAGCLAGVVTAVLAPVTMSIGVIARDLIQRSSAGAALYAALLDDVAACLFKDCLAGALAVPLFALIGGAFGGLAAVQGTGSGKSRPTPRAVTDGPDARARPVGDAGGRDHVDPASLRIRPVT